MSTFLITFQLLLFEYFPRWIEIDEPGVHPHYLGVIPHGVLLQPEQRLHIQGRGGCGCLVALTWEIWTRVLSDYALY